MDVLEKGLCTTKTRRIAARKGSRLAYGLVYNSEKQFHGLWVENIRLYKNAIVTI